MKDKISEVIRYATLAPSGENAQPWRFVVRDNVVNLYFEASRASGLYDWGRRGSLIGLGAALENVSIAAPSLGLNFSVTMFPKGEGANNICEIEFFEVQPVKHPLFDFLESRCSNRKPYRPDLKINQTEALETISNQSGVCKLYYTTDTSNIVSLASVGSANDKIMLENKTIHDFFFSHVNWTKEEDEAKHVGFYLPTLELPPPAVQGFKLLKNWSIAKWLVKLGMSNLVAKQNLAVYAKSGGMVCIEIPENTQLNYLEAGRLTQRFWLTAASVGLNVQPLAGLFFMANQIDTNSQTRLLNTKHVSLIQEKIDLVKSVFNIPTTHTVAMMFRIGQGEPPTARSSRFNVSEVVEYI
jgi:hypothetical protein